MTEQLKAVLVQVERLSAEEQDLLAAELRERLRDPHAVPRFQTFDEFFTELGLSPEDIKQAELDADI